jgi:hypothetical protein
LSYVENIGPFDDGERWTLSLQPRIPIPLNADWALISHTVIPLVLDQKDIFPGAGSQEGIGDIIQSVFLVPNRLIGGWIMGAGPVALLPTGSDDLLTADKWGVGPTAVAVKEQGDWTYTGLVSHIWSIAGDDDRNDVSATVLGPSAAYTTDSAWTLTIGSESMYDWESDDWSIPVGISAKKMLPIGNQKIQLGGGISYYVESADFDPEGWGGNISFAIIF